MQVRLVPQGLIGRVILVFLAAVLLELLVSSRIFEMADLSGARTLRADAFADKLAMVARTLESTTPQSRPVIARALSTDKASVRWEAAPSLRLNTPQSIRGLAEEMRRSAPQLGQRDLRLWPTSRPTITQGAQLTASVRLADGSAAYVTSRLRPRSHGLVWAGLGSALVFSGAILTIAIVLLRSLGSPLRALAHAADHVGKGAPVHVPEEGAADLKRVARAFNAMQQRISDLLKARTHALAAVSHDLRTPLARIRLRASLIGEKAARKALEEDVDEMIGMLDSLLAYLGGRHEDEPRRQVDLAALCMTLTDAAADEGRPVRYSGPERLVAGLQASAVRRAVDNLMQNALAYGDRADVTLLAQDGRAVIRVEDEGPGIPERELAKVREPFTRLDAARARNTSGLGLGLSIVQRVADQHGGELALANRTGGGLRAELRLPI